MQPDDPHYLQYLRMMYCLGDNVSDTDVQMLADRAERTVASVQTRRRLGLLDNEASVNLYDVVVRKLDRARRLKRETALADYAYGDNWLAEMEARGALALLCTQLVSAGTGLEDGLTAHFADQPHCGREQAPAQARRTIEALKLHPGADRDFGITDTELAERACLLFLAAVEQHLPQLESAADRGVPPHEVIAT